MKSAHPGRTSDSQKIGQKPSEKDTGENKVIATVRPSMDLPRSRCGDLCNFGYAVVSYMNAKVLEELVKITEDLEKPSPNHQTPATPRRGREAGKVEVRRNHRIPVETKTKKSAPTSTLPTSRGYRDEDRAEAVSYTHLTLPTKRIV